MLLPFLSTEIFLLPAVTLTISEDGIEIVCAFPFFLTVIFAVFRLYLFSKACYKLQSYPSEYLISLVGRLHTFYN